ncbi:MAG: M13 family metallopeptidase [Deltaproteobacteria bacterium]|nr:M13 family metallopeptidase [Deltaproteobacteria bacterium]
MKARQLVLLALCLTSSAFATIGDPTQVPDIIDANAINHAVNPCDDFYQYACGKWLGDLSMPSDKSTYYHQFTALDDKTRETLKTLIETAPSGSRLGRFYISCMNESSAAQSGRQTLTDRFANIDLIQNSQQLATAVAQLHLLGANVFFNFGSAQDLNDATQVIGFAAQGGMSLPERDYYLKTDAKSVETRKEFAAHVAKMLVLTDTSGGYGTPAADQAAAILAFETKLASAAFSLEDQGDPSKINHPVGAAGLKGLAPAFDWDGYFAALGTSAPAALNVTEPDFYTNLNTVLATTSLDQLKSYLKWQVVKRSAMLMGTATEEESFRFWQGYLAGKKQLEPRWKRCTNIVSSDLGDEVGKAFVDTINGASDTKRQTRTLIETIKGIFSGNLDSLTWLDSPTVAAAREKLSHVNDKVAFPDKWKDYSSVEISDSTLLQNDLNATRFESRRQLAKIGRPVDRTEWQMPPWEINAYYDPSLNEIVFPYGILQSPVFNLKASDGANMGALGATVGHELTHGFDNDGSKYDGLGNVKSWWPDEIRRGFEERAQCLIDQASKYEVLPGLFVNGTRTLTENIADQGGTKLAYLAYKRMSAGRPAAAPVAGFDENQQYFVSYAQSWCAKRTDESMRQQLISNTHPPEEFRVNGVLMNIPAFGETFGCREGSRMAPKNRCAVW